MGPRAGLSTILILGSIVLLFAIVFGQSMGNRVLSQIASRPSEISATPVPSPSSSADDERTTPLWKRHQVISVATDPAFPDPRITPEPTPPPTDEPRYTSPPLPIPLVSAAPDESPPADEPASPAPSPTPTARGAKPRPEFTGRGYPSFPPSTPQP